MIENAVHGLSIRELFDRLKSKEFKVFLVHPDSLCSLRNKSVILTMRGKSVKEIRSRLDKAQDSGQFPRCFSCKEPYILSQDFDAETGIQEPRIEAVKRPVIDIITGGGR